MPTHRSVGWALSLVAAAGLSLPAAGAQTPSEPAPSEPAPSEPAGTGLTPVEPTPVEALRSGEVWLELRARFEHVEDEAFGRDAEAATLRTVLGYQSGAWRDLRALLEFEAVTNLGDESYDSTTNGVSGRPVVADPEGAEINQVMLTWDGREDTSLWLGRRRIQLDNDRFVGNVGWRQNEQTFDSAGFEYRLGERARLFYAYVQNVNRVFGDDHPLGDARMNSHLVNLAGQVGDLGRLVGYWYLLDGRSPAALDAFSTSTLGTRLTGERPLGELSLLYTAELATQRDFGDNPGDVDADYWRAELGLRRERLSAKLGYELLSGSGAPGDKFTTPLATLHSHNGWADVFLSTPDTGIADLFASLSGAWGQAGWELAWHDFSADSGGADYGTEIDLSLGFDLTETVRAGLKLARYDAEDFAADTTKAWFWLSTTLL